MSIHSEELRSLTDTWASGQSGDAASIAKVASVYTRAAKSGGKVDMKPSNFITTKSSNRQILANIGGYLVFTYSETQHSPLTPGWVLTVANSILELYKNGVLDADEFVSVSRAETMDKLNAYEKKRKDAVTSKQQADERSGALTNQAADRLVKQVDKVIDCAKASGLTDEARKSLQSALNTISSLLEVDSDSGESVEVVDTLVSA